MNVNSSVGFLPPVKEDTGKLFAGDNSRSIGSGSGLLSVRRHRSLLHCG